MIDCHARWAERLLCNELSEEETNEFETHLGHCSTCQARLVEVAGGQRILETANAMFSSSCELPQWQSTSSIAPTTFPLPDHRESKPYSHAVDLSILGPTDDPQFMGRIGNYEVQGVIGRGGMGVVFRALDRALHRNVAIKVLDPAMASVEAARQRFALEARAMAAISHEHVVPVYTVDEHRGLPYFAMEYIPGGTLESRIRQQGPLDLLSILRISRQIALALSAAHDCGLVHRDIKPANVLIDRGIERVRVTDFGLARVNSDASHTRSGFIAGTPQFMSPEQVRGELCTEKSDLFSLGSVMYAMCTGQSPFHCDSIYGAMQRVVHDQPIPVRELAPNLPPWMEGFVGKLLNKESEKRFENAAHVADLLEKEIAFVQNPSDAAKPNRAEYEPSHGTQRSTRLRWLATLILSVICVITVALVANRWIPPVQDVTEKLPWKSESTDSIREGLMNVERKTFQSDPIPELDSWHRDVQSLKRSLEAFERKNH